MALFEFVEIETCSHCNLRCKSCPVRNMRRDERFLSEEMFHSLVDQLADIDFEGVFSTHFYNEPFADPRMHNFLAYTARKLPKARIIVFTNATLLTPELFRSVAPHVTEFVVTVDEKAILAAYENLADALTPEEKTKIRTRSITEDATYNRGGLVDTGKNLHKMKKCVFPSYYCIVNAWGNVVLCFNDYQASETFGNVHERPLLDIWNSERYVKVRQDIANGRFDLDICRRCETNNPVVE